MDYGCGWGRIASVVLTKGGPQQLDLCDAWPETLTVLREAGFTNRILAASEVLKDGELEAGRYDFIYAYSVFTHLRMNAFLNNIRVLQRSLKPSGKLYITVRHADYMKRENAEAKPKDFKALSRDGFGSGLPATANTSAWRSSIACG